MGTISRSGTDQNGEYPVRTLYRTISPHIMYTATSIGPDRFLRLPSPLTLESTSFSWSSDHLKMNSEWQKTPLVANAASLLNQELYTPSGRTKDAYSILLRVYNINRWVW